MEWKVGDKAMVEVTVDSAQIYFDGKIKVTGLRVDGKAHLVDFECLLPVAGSLSDAERRVAEEEGGPPRPSPPLPSSAVG